MALDHKTADKITAHVSRAFTDAVKQWIDEYCAKTGHDQRSVTLVVGKALVLDGGMLIGASLQVGADPSIKIVDKCLREFKRLGLEKRGLEE